MSTMYLEQDSKTKTRIVKIAHVLRKKIFFLALAYAKKIQKATPVRFWLAYFMLYQ